MKTRREKLAALEELSCRYRRKSCEPCWLKGKAGEFLVDHWEEVKAVIEGVDST